MHTFVLLYFALEEVDILGETVVVDGMGDGRSGVHVHRGNRYVSGRDDDIHFLACRDSHFHLEFELRIVLVRRVLRVDHVVVHERQPEVVSFGG